MKKILLMASLCLSIINGANAQYFHHLYSKSATDGGIMSFGVNTQIAPPGHFMVGVSPNTDIIATYTDINGNFSGPNNFNNVYTIPGYSVQRLTGFEYNNGFGIIGTRAPIGTSNFDLFYIKLDFSGNVLGAYTYTNSSLMGAASAIKVGKSASNNEVYVTGYGNSNMGGGPIALKIDIATGNMLWGNLYIITGADGEGNDIIESPYAPLGVKEVVIAGYTIAWQGSGFYDDGLVMRLNANTGLPLAFTNAATYGSSLVNEHFNSIAVANSTAGGSNGFVLGGWSDKNGSTNNSDGWIHKINPVGNSVWSKLYERALYPGSLDQFNDVIERVNTSGKYEYYAGGYSYAPLYLLYVKTWVVKTDDLGVGVANGEFVYGTNSDAQTCISLDQYNGRAYDGLSIYGEFSVVASAISSMQHIKAYFNGVSGCDEEINTPTPTPGDSRTGEPSISVQNDFTQAPLTIPPPTTAIDNVICYSQSVPGGSNAKLGTTGIVNTAINAKEDISLSPNPVYAQDKLVSINIGSEKDAKAGITLIDIMGKKLIQQTAALSKGDNHISLDIAQLNLAAGIYNVMISIGDKTTSVKLTVQH